MSRDHGFELDERYVVEVFAESEVTGEEIVRMWEREGAMPAEEAERRLDEVYLVATVAGEGVVAVTTVYLEHNTQLRTNMWYFRSFVAAAHRASALSVVMTSDTRDLLRRAYETGEDRRAPGMVMEVENEGLKQRFPHAIWYYVWFYFIGLNARGDHVRVHWFPGAELPEP